MRKNLALATFLAVTSLSFAAEAPQVGMGVFGDLRIGMSERQLAEMAGAPVEHIDAETEEEGCFYGSVPGLPSGVSLMLLNGRLARIDVSVSGILTRSGAGIGTPEPILKRIYGAKLEQTPHAYLDPEGHYLTLLATDGKLGLRFETDGAKVTSYYTGTAEAIQYIEGCL